MENLKLGQLIGPEQQRDAVHIAVAPVVADENLMPGWRIGFVPGSQERVARAHAPGGIGIVDPFLTEPVFKDQRFWMFLLPNTITSLRHEWTHPAFVEQAAPARPPVPESEQFLRDVADEVGLSYGRLLVAAREWIADGDYLVGGCEMEGAYTPEGFWRHFQNVTGEVVPEDRAGNFFSCSC